MRPHNTRMAMIFQRGLYCMGLLVLAVSITQGWAGIIGSVLLVMMMGAVGSLAVWLFGAVQRRY